MKRALIAAIVAVSGCGPTVAAPSPVASTPSPTASVAVSALPRSVLKGTTLTMPADPDMVSFHADGAALIATRSKGTPPPYDSTIVRADASGGPWALVYETDAMFMVDRVANGRVGFIEYRAPYQGGGAYSNDFVVLDLASGVKTEIDRFALSAATYRGGGGGPRRPVGAIVLGPDHVAWTRLVEGSGGSITGELRIASLADPAEQQLVATSSEWIRPLDIDAERLVYVLGGRTEDALHVRDIATGADRVLLTGAVGDTVRGVIPDFDQAAVSGDWAVWLTDPKNFASKGQALNVRTGERRDLETGGSSCYGVSAGTRYFAWGCGKSSDAAAPPVLVIDAKTLEPLATLPSGIGVGVDATGDGLIWFNVNGSSRTVTLFRP